MKNGSLTVTFLSVKRTFAVELEHAIDQQKGIAMRQQAEEAIEIVLLVVSQGSNRLAMFVRHERAMPATYFEIVERPSSDGAGAAGGGGIEERGCRPEPNSLPPVRRRLAGSCAERSGLGIRSRRSCG